MTSANRTSDPIAKKARLPTVTLDAALGTNVSVGLVAVMRQCSALAGIRPI